jgi:hypothetical protein
MQYPTMTVVARHSTLTFVVKPHAVIAVQVAQMIVEHFLSVTPSH